jgi:hypothetical protein
VDLPVHVALYTNRENALAWYLDSPPLAGARLMDEKEVVFLEGVKIR